jgi:hypothetical protein
MVDSIFCVFGLSHAGDNEAVGYTEKGMDFSAKRGMASANRYSEFLLAG